MIMKYFLALAALLCLLAPVAAQTQTDDEVVKINTNLVQVDVVVTKDGKPVTNLKAEDFEIFENGRRQTITSFAYISNVANAATSTSSPQKEDPNAPETAGTTTTTPNVNRRVLAIVIDDLGLSVQSTSEIRRQMRRFLDEQWDRNDLLAFVFTSTAKKVKPHFTNDRNVLDRAWEQIIWNHCSRVGTVAVARLSGPPGDGCGAYNSQPSDTMDSLRATVDAMGELPGRKSMLVLSDSMPLRDKETLIKPGSSVTSADEPRGDPRNYRASLNRLTEKAIRASVVIYTVDASGLQVTGLRASDEFSDTRAPGNMAYNVMLRMRSEMIQHNREAAAALAKDTGGFLIKDQNHFQFDKILEDQSGYYLIGYRPSSETFDKKFNELRARVKKSGMTVRTRSGFFGMTEDEAKSQKK